jgi:hypothetical protein
MKEVMGRKFRIICGEGSSLDFSFRRVALIQGGPRRGKIRKQEEAHEKIVITL